MIKDKPALSIKGKLIEISHGRRFPIYKNFVSIGITLFVIIIMLFPSESNAYKLIIPGCILVIVIIFSANVGIEIKQEIKKYRYYFSIFGIRWGSWEAFNNFSCLVLKTSTKQRSNEYLNEEESLSSPREKFKSTELYLMDSAHRKKLLCGSFDNYNEAKQFAEEVSKKMDYPIERFSPEKIRRWL